MPSTWNGDEEHNPEESVGHDHVPFSGHSAPGRQAGPPGPLGGPRATPNYPTHIPSKIKVPKSLFKSTDKEGNREGSNGTDRDGAYGHYEIRYLCLDLIVSLSKQASEEVVFVKNFDATDTIGVSPRPGVLLRELLKAGEAKGLRPPAIQQTVCRLVKSDNLLRSKPYDLGEVKGCAYFISGTGKHWLAVWKGKLPVDWKPRPQRIADEKARKEAGNAEKIRT
jgi:hypothetical protein